MVPLPVVVCERTNDLSEHVWTDGLVEGRTETSVGHYSELRRTHHLAFRSKTVKFRREIELGGGREIGKDENRRSGDSFSIAEVPRPTDPAWRGLSSRFVVAWCT